MRKVVVEYDVYKYEELNDSAKENVKRWYLDGKDSYVFTETCKEDLNCLFGYNHNLNVQYSLAHCQGDGLNVYGSIDAKDIIECIKDNNGGTQFKPYRNWLTDEQMETILDYAEMCGEIKIPMNISYCYCMADYIDFASDWISDLKWDWDYNEEKIDKNTIYQFETMVSAIFKSICKDYEKTGYEYFYEVTDEELEEVCDIMDYEFYEDGRFFG